MIVKHNKALSITKLPLICVFVLVTLIAVLLYGASKSKNLMNIVFDIKEYVEVPYELNGNLEHPIVFQEKITLKKNTLYVFAGTVSGSPEARFDFFSPGYDNAEQQYSLPPGNKVNLQFEHLINSGNPPNEEVYVRAFFQDANSVTISDFVVYEYGIVNKFVETIAILLLIFATALFFRLFLNRPYFTILFYLVLLTMIFYGILNSTYGIETVSMMKVFEGDETQAVIRFISNIQANNLSPYGFFNYGYFMQTIVFWIAKLFIDVFDHTLSVQMIAFLFRMLSLASFGIAAVLITELVSFLTDNKKVAYIAGLFMISIPNLYYWAQRVHPDTLSLVLVTLCILITVKTHSVRAVIIASIIAGLSFGTKYSGIFLLPFLAVPLILKWHSHKGKFRFWASLGILALSVVMFTSSWLISNPYVTPQWGEFVNDFLFEKAHVAYGHGVEESKNAFLWIPIFNGQFTVIGTALMFTGAFYWFGSIVKNLKRFGHKLFTDLKSRSIVFLLLYLIVGLLYLGIEVHMRVPRYFFHLLPALIVLGVTGIYKLYMDFNWKKSIFQSKMVISIIVLMLFGSTIFLNIRAMSDMSSDSQKRNHLTLQGGNFLLNQRYGADTKIVADYYSYIPEGFTNVTMVGVIDENVLQKFSPELIIMNRDYTSKWGWKREGTSFAQNEFVQGTAPGAETYFRFYQKLFSDSNWNIVYENEGLVILELIKEIDIIEK